MKKKILFSIIVISIISSIIFLKISSNNNYTNHQDIHDGHDHGPGSITEAIIYTGSCTVDNHLVEVNYSDTLGDIVDVKITVYNDKEQDLVELSRNGQLTNDLNPPLYEQIDRLVQYMIGFNEYPTFNDDGTSDELITLTIDLKQLSNCINNAQQI